jgi:hypothetical protein
METSQHHRRSLKRRWAVSIKCSQAHSLANGYRVMLSEYTCVYGISSTSDLTPGDIDIVHAKHLSAIFIAGKDRRTFWFFFIRMDKKYHVPDIPRWTKQDAEKQIEDHLDFKITDKVTLGDIWKTRLSYTLVSLEEADFKEWSWGRIVCLGDSAHKVSVRLIFNDPPNPDRPL